MADGKGMTNAERRARNKLRATLPRPPLTAKDLSDIAKGGNKDVIMQRRAAINRGIRRRQAAGQDN